MHIIERKAVFVFILAEEPTLQWLILCWLRQVLYTIYNVYTLYIRLSLVVFQLWRVLEQLAPEIFLIFFFKTCDLSMVQLTQKIKKISKK